ncbi:hypothetical protein HN011_003731 [Eciton burchellii]|nr:hypothetical protein HN011_003731 [Eciton burchellii]
MEELETLESTECPECPGPPPEFRLPPPPRPPFLTEGTFCSESPLAELEDCVAIPVFHLAFCRRNPLVKRAFVLKTLGKYIREAISDGSSISKNTERCRRDTRYACPTCDTFMSLT